jgi:hypothetical protein
VFVGDCAFVENSRNLGRAGRYIAFVGERTFVENSRCRKSLAVLDEQRVRSIDA